jgi:hypothetical protein
MAASRSSVSAASTPESFTGIGFVICKKAVAPVWKRDE